MIGTSLSIRVSLYLKGNKTKEEHIDFQKNLFKNIENITSVDLSKFFSPKKVRVEIASLPKIDRNKPLHNIDFNKEKKIYIHNTERITTYFVTHHRRVSEKDLQIILGTMRYYMVQTDRKDMSVEIARLEGKTSVNSLMFLHWQSNYQWYGYNDTAHASRQIYREDADFRDYLNKISMQYVNNLLEENELKPVYEISED